MRRFVGYFRPRPLTAAELVWVAEQLNPGEWALWQRHRPQDRRHSVDVACAVQRAGSHDEPAPSWLISAALLHDIGKTVADLSAAGRVAAALAKLAGVRSAPGRLGVYLRYPDLGSALLCATASHPLVIAWAAEHHHHRLSTSQVPAGWASVLAAADDAAV